MSRPLSSQSWPQLRASAWLSALPETAAQRLLDLARPLALSAGSLLHAKGESCKGLYGLEQGQIHVSSVSLSGDELILTRLQPGEWFGEIAVIDGGPRTHDSYAVGNCRLAWLDSAALETLAQQEPRFYYWIGLLLCQHVRASFSAIDQFLLLSPRQRLAQRLLQLSLATPDTAIQMSQESLAALVGLSRQSVSKTLSRWRQTGIIRLHYGGVEILQREALLAELPAELHESEILA